MATVTIGMTAYDSYEDLSGADAYLAARIGSAGVWDSTTPTDDVKGQALVTASRWILEYIRPRVASGDLVEPDDATIPQFLQDAASELAFSLVVDSAIQDNATTGSNVERVKAGSAEVQFFRPTSGKAFPERVMVLLNAWLDEVGTVSGISVPVAEGTDEESTFEDIDEYGYNDGLS